jgi:hypothetical protein
MTLNSIERDFLTRLTETSNGSSIRHGKDTEGESGAQEGPMKTVLIYVNISVEVGDVGHLKVFVNEDAAEK